VKLSVVPDSSARFTGVIGVAGSVTPGLSAAMAGSFHVVICRLKIRAMVEGAIWRESMPSRLKMTAIGEMYSGIWMTLSGPPQTCWAAGSSSSSSMASVPANWTAPAVN
jgi:hypothetical protein